MHKLGYFKSWRGPCTGVQHPILDGATSAHLHPWSRTALSPGRFATPVILIETSEIVSTRITECCCRKQFVAPRGPCSGRRHHSLSHAHAHTRPAGQETDDCRM